MKNIIHLNLDNVTEEEAKSFEIRNASRAVLIDNQNNIALMKVNSENYYKLPGGGIEEGEDTVDTLKRECLEEAGVEIDTAIELLTVIEMKKNIGMVQNSYCFIAHVVGEKKMPQLTESETERGFEVIWVTIDEAIRLVENENVRENGRSVHERELMVLKAARESGLLS